jgi:hypothetical protein
MAGPVLKVLGQLDSATPGVNTDADLYTVPAATSTVVSTLSVANRGAAAHFTIKIRVAGAASATKQHLVSGIALTANETMFFTLGITLATTDVITVQADTTTVTFQAFGQES